MVSLDHKKQLAERFEEYLTSYKSMMMLDTTNMNSAIVVEIKNRLLDSFDCQMLHGKKASFAKRLREMAQKEPKYEQLVSIIKGDVFCLFTNDSCAKAWDIVSSYSKSGSPFYGRKALLDFWIEPQLTRLANEHTKVFQKLRVPTKITKGNMEITARFQVLYAGKPVNQMQLDVLSALNLFPYTYRVALRGVWTCGCVADPAIYDLKPKDIADGAAKCARDASALSFGTGFPTRAVALAGVNKALFDALSLSCALKQANSAFEPSETFAAKIALLDDPEALAKLQAAAASAATAQAETAPAEAEVPEEEEEEEVSIDMDF